MIITPTKKFALLSFLISIFTSVQAANSERQRLAIYGLLSDFYKELVLFKNTDQTYQWILIGTDGEETNLNAVEFSQGVALIHFDSSDTHVVPFELQNSSPDPLNSLSTLNPSISEHQNLSDDSIYALLLLLWKLGFDFVSIQQHNNKLS